MCFTEKTHVKKFIYGLGFALTDRVVNQWPQNLASSIQLEGIVCLSKEVLNGQFGRLKKDKRRSTISGNNSKNVTN